MNNLEVTKITDTSRLDSEKRKCVICMEEYIQGDNAIYLPCFHLYHEDCIREWLQNHDTCPVCKLKLTSQNMN